MIHAITLWETETSQQGYLSGEIWDYCSVKEEKFSSQKSSSQGRGYRLTLLTPHVFRPW